MQQLCVGMIDCMSTPASDNTQDIAYSYDQLGNLTTRINGVQGVEEVFTYDNLLRLTQSTRTAILSGDLTSTETVDYAYDNLGNLTYKSDWGSYDYGGSAGIDSVASGGTGSTYRPHQVGRVTREDNPDISYHYDANGNLVKGNNRDIAYNHQQKPTLISQTDEQGARQAGFDYDAGHARFRQVSSEGDKTTTTYYLGKLYEKVVTETAGTGTKTEYRLYIGDFAMVKYENVGEGSECRNVRYLHTDRLGSVETVTDGNGKVLERHGYDAFGKPRAANWMLDSRQGGLIDGRKGLFSNITTRGFTGHEHVDSVGIIHMNGRGYDPELGRFLSVDPVLQFPDNSQSLNPYSYIMNNPMSGTDPSGFSSEEGSPRPINGCGGVPCSLSYWGRNINETNNPRIVGFGFEGSMVAGTSFSEKKEEIEVEFMELESADIDWVDLIQSTGGTAGSDNSGLGDEGDYNNSSESVGPLIPDDLTGTDGGEYIDENNQRTHVVGPPIGYRAVENSTTLTGIGLSFFERAKIRWHAPKGNIHLQSNPSFNSNTLNIASKSTRPVLVDLTRGGKIAGRALYGVYLFTRLSHLGTKLEEMRQEGKSEDAMSDERIDAGLDIAFGAVAFLGLPGLAIAASYWALDELSGGNLYIPVRDGLRRARRVHNYMRPRGWQRDQ